MWLTEWRAISARIAGLLDAGRFLLGTGLPDAVPLSAQYQSEVPGAAHIKRASGILGKNAYDLGEVLQLFFDSQGSHLADTARACLKVFVEETRRWFSPEPRLSELAAVIVAYASFRAEFEYLIANSETVAKSLVVRGFTHLQSSIVADGVVRTAWQQAFGQRETKCERLGAAHLLLHGIWSFKADASTGGRTDLALGERTDPWDEAERAATGLVLTEWKLVRRPGELYEKAQDSKRQAKLYIAEPLAGFEVASTRYLVLVSEGRLKMPDPVVEADVRYEYWNIAVDPKIPSHEATR